MLPILRRTSSDDRRTPQSSFCAAALGLAAPAQADIAPASSTDGAGPAAARTARGTPSRVRRSCDLFRSTATTALARRFFGDAYTAPCGARAEQ